MASNSLGFGHDADAPLTGGLYGSGLAANRNDPRTLMALKLMGEQMPSSIPGAGPSIAAAIGGIARALAAGKLMSDQKDDQDKARQDELDRRTQMEQGARDFAAGGAAGAVASRQADAADTASPAAPAMSPPSKGRGAQPPAELMPVYQQAAKDSGVPLHILLGKDAQESGFDPLRVGGAGENGIAQILPSTGAQPGYGLPAISPDDARDPTKAIPWASRYLAARGKAAGVTDWTDQAQAAKGLAAYNGAGPAAASYAQTVLGRAGQFAAPPPPSGPQPSGQQLAQPLLNTSAPTAPSPAGAAMAARLSPETVFAMQARAEEAAASPNPLISRQAPGLMAQARSQQASLDRQNAADQRSQDATIRGRERAEDRAAAADLARQNRNPMVQDVRDPDGSGKVGRYAVNPDGSLGHRLGDAPQQPGPAAPPPTVSTDAGVFNRNPDGSLGTRLGGLPRQAEVDKPAKPLSDGVTKGILGNMSSLRQLDQAIAAVDRTPDAFGAQNRIPGATIYQSAFGDQANNDARAQVANIGSLKLHERSGAAVTASEYPRLAPFVPSSTDSADTARTKLQGMRRIVMEQMQDQYDTYGPDNGYKPVPGHARALGIGGGEGLPTPPVPPSDAVPAGGAPPAASPPQQQAQAAPPPPVPAQQPGGDAGVSRRTAAVAQARQMLGPNASDAEIIAKAQELVGR